MNERTQALVFAAVQSGRPQSGGGEEHILFPQSEAELTALITRLGGLAGRVMGAQEWRSLFSATRRLLPREERMIVEPTDMNVLQYSSSDNGRVLSATLRSFSSIETFARNRRYSIGEWISLTRDYYGLATYAFPPRQLEFSLEFLSAAKKSSTDSYIRAASIIVRNDPLLIRQVVSRADIKKWNESLAEEIAECLDTAEEYERLADEGELERDEYNIWFYRSEEVISIAREFYSAFSSKVPRDLRKLEALKDEIPEPEYTEPYAGSTEDGEEIEYPEYWTVARMFEDL